MNAATPPALAAAAPPADIVLMPANSDCLCKGPKKCGRCHLVALARAQAQRPTMPRPAAVVPLGAPRRGG